MSSACVTGATGYVASELIRQLLSRGYAIKATVRCPTDSPRLQYLRDLAGSGSGSLQLVQVPDLQQLSEALDTAISGAQYLFHVASPFRFDGDPNNDIVQPAVQGTRTVLETAAKHKPGLKRVVVTSSVCGESGKQKAPDIMLTAVLVVSPTQHLRVALGACACMDLQCYGRLLGYQSGRYPLCPYDPCRLNILITWWI